MELRMGMQGVNDRAWNAAWINMSLSLDDVGRLGELQSDLGWPSHQCPTPAHRTQSIGTFSPPLPNGHHQWASIREAPGMRAYSFHKYLRQGSRHDFIKGSQKGKRERLE